MLYDFEDDPLIYLYRQKAASSDGLGMSINDAVGGEPFQGRISRLNSSQITAWGTLGLQCDGDLYCLRDDLGVGDVVVDDAGVTYLVQGRSRSINKGTLHTYWKYGLKTQSLS